MDMNLTWCWCYLGDKIKSELEFTFDFLKLDWGCKVLGVNLRCGLNMEIEWNFFNFNFTFWHFEGIEWNFGLDSHWVTGFQLNPIRLILKGDSFKVNRCMGNDLKHLLIYWFVFNSFWGFKLNQSLLMLS